MENFKYYAASGIMEPNKIVSVVCGGKEVWKGLTEDAARLDSKYDFVRFDNTIYESADFSAPDYRIIATLKENRLPVDRKKDPEFGVPSKEKFPLFDKDHVLSAMRFFNYVDKEDEDQLASAILAKMKEYGIPTDRIGEDNRLRNHIPAEEPKEALAEASTAFKRAYRAENPGEHGDYIDGKAIARVKDPNERARLIATKRLEISGKIGDRPTVKQELGRKVGQAEMAYEQKAEKAQKAGLADQKQPLSENKLADRELDGRESEGDARKDDPKRFKIAARDTDGKRIYIDRMTRGKTAIVDGEERPLNDAGEVIDDIVDESMLLEKAKDPDDPDEVARRKRIDDYMKKAQRQQAVGMMSQAPETKNYYKFGGQDRADAMYRRFPSMKADPSMEDEVMRAVDKDPVERGRADEYERFQTRIEAAAAKAKAAPAGSSDKK